MAQQRPRNCPGTECCRERGQERGRVLKGKKKKLVNDKGEGPVIPLEKDLRFKYRLGSTNSYRYRDQRATVWLVLSLHHVGTRHQIQVARLGSKSLHPLCHLTGLSLWL